MAVQLYNTLTQKKEVFTPLHPPAVNIYICGVTPYDFSHVGHARVYVGFDVAFRHLRRRGYQVKVVRNFTDVEDKIINRANKEGVGAGVISERFIEAYRQDMATLKVGPVDVEPKVTTHMEAIIKLVEELVATGHAYSVDGEAGGKDVYYAVNSFQDYLKLSHRSKDDLQAGARVEVDDRKKDPLDFALWKSAKPREPSWDSPWGKGRPGWHIECSAMCRQHVGATVDIHAGGRDLIFPHHENEIAQSEAVTGQPLAKYWLHNGFVNIDNEKMSKSLGNFFTIREVLQKVSPDALRYFLLGTHYRSPINFSDTLLDESERRVEALYESSRRAKEYLAQNPPEEGPALAAMAKGTKAEPLVGAGIQALFDEAMDDDFNTARALSVVADAVRLCNMLMDGKEAELLGKKLPPRTRARLVKEVWEDLAGTGGILRTLGVVDEEPDGYLTALRDRRSARHGIDAAWVAQRIEARAAAKANKDFAAADAIRAELAARHVVIKDSPAGTRWTVEDSVAG